MDEIILNIFKFLQTPGCFCKWIFLVLLGGLFTCNTPPGKYPDPASLPYRFEISKKIGAKVLFKDLDGDGRNELICRGRKTDFPEYDYLTINTRDEKTLAQVNFAGKIRQPFFLDFDDDDVLEIVVPEIRHDSLFVHFVTSQGKKLFRLFLTTGESRRETEKLIRWDADVSALYLIDLNRDGRKELVSVINAGLARLPRGIFVHSVPDGQRIGQKIVGARLHTLFLDDFNGDGIFEIIAQTVTPNNGARAGGFDDSHCYLIVFELRPQPEIVWWKKIGKKTAMSGCFATILMRTVTGSFSVFVNPSRPTLRNWKLLNRVPGRPRGSWN